jgi:hypothetical protein
LDELDELLLFCIRIYVCSGVLLTPQNQRKYSIMMEKLVQQISAGCGASALLAPSGPAQWGIFVLTDAGHGL